MNAIKFVHTNIVAEDWKLLTDFYIQVFDCKPILPERKLKGDWLDKGTGLKDAKIEGIHLRLPGFSVGGPTLEIFQYNNIDKGNKKKINTCGMAHLAFLVEDVEKVLNKAIKFGASQIGELTQQEIEGVGKITFVYISDPEDNIIEIQHWS